jgi:cell division initiation protein
MKLSPLDIKKQEFARTLRGYDPDEVKAFLDMMARQWEEVQGNQRQLEDKVRELEGKLVHYQRVEEALQEALQTARESSKQALANAKEKARLILKQAHSEAEDIKRSAVQDKERLEQQADKLQGRRDEIVARLRAFLMSEVELLSHFDGGSNLLAPHRGSPADEEPSDESAAEVMETAEFEVEEEPSDLTAPVTELDLDAPMPPLDTPFDEDEPTDSPDDLHVEDEGWYFGEEDEAFTDEPSMQITDEDDAQPTPESADLQASDDVVAALSDDERTVVEEETLDTSYLDDAATEPWALEDEGDEFDEELQFEEDLLAQIEDASRTAQASTTDESDADETTAGAVHPDDAAEPITEPEPAALNLSPNDETVVEVEVEPGEELEPSEQAAAEAVPEEAPEDERPGEPVAETDLAGEVAPPVDPSDQDEHDPEVLAEADVEPEADLEPVTEADDEVASGEDLLSTEEDRAVPAKSTDATPEPVAEGEQGSAPVDQAPVEEIEEIEKEEPAEKPVDDAALAFDFLEGDDDLDDAPDVETLLRDVEELAEDRSDEDFPFEELRERLMGGKAEDESEVTGDLPPEPETDTEIEADALAIDEDLTGAVDPESTAATEDEPDAKTATHDVEAVADEPSSADATTDLDSSEAATDDAEDEPAPRPPSSSGAGWLVKPSLSSSSTSQSDATNHTADASGGEEGEADEAASDEIEKIRRILNDLE